MSNWKENVIIVDANHLDVTALNLTVYFERMINRPIPKADLCHWLDCVALDGGIRQGQNQIQVVFIHDKEKQQLDCFAPGRFSDELNGQAFKDHLGEFELASFPVEEVVSKADFFEQSLEAVIAAESVKTVMVVASMDEYGDQVKKQAQKAEGKDVVLFSMSPTEERGFKQENLGYSLISALGVKSEEL